MKYKKCIFVFLVCFITLLSGCGNNLAGIDNSEFIKYDIEAIMQKIEYRVCNTTENVTMYFPVVTNKAITKTELSGVAAKLPMKQENVKVSLKVAMQDKLNLLYDGKFVSFLKYQVKIENEEVLHANDCLTLCDTTLWIYHNSEFEKVEIDEDFLQITIVDNEDEIALPDWNNIISNISSNIKFQLYKAN